MTDTDIFLPTLPDEAFTPLPDGIELTGSPDDFRFTLFFLPKFGRFEREEAAGRILIILAKHGSWATIDASAFNGQLLDEYRAIMDGRKSEYCHHGQMPVWRMSGIRKIHEGLNELINMDLLGCEVDNEERITCFWPTPKFVEFAEPHRVTQLTG